MKSRPASIAAKHDQSPLVTTRKGNSVGSFNDGPKKAEKVNSQTNYSHMPQLNRDTYKGAMRQKQPADPLIKFPISRNISQRNQ